MLDLDPNLLLNTQTKSNCLHIACKQGFYQIAYFLISNSRVNLRQLNSNGDDCLMIAIKNNDYNMVKFLLFETVQNKLKCQLDFNNGNGDREDLHAGP